MATLKKYPGQLVFGLDIGTRSIVGTVGFKENNKFNIVAQSVKFHDTRAMKDGQIHDIAKVGESIATVKKDLELQLDGRKLKEVCIAAAGRVLKTAVGVGEYEFTENTIINQEYIHSLELIGVEKAHDIITEENHLDIKFYCVGYTVIKYFLNDYEITNLEGHKATKISADVLATFLPEEVIDGLYAAVKIADLEVANLTLEPIAAINLAIPEEYRLLNIGLVDVGAGTSDISVTKDGSIIGYGMIPSAGDEITEAIVKKYLVDFKTAEKIKMIGKNKKNFVYKDILGISHKINAEEVYATVSSVVDEITTEIAGKITELNGGKSISAVFVVGGGGKLTGFTDAIASKLNLPGERVALRGEEVLQDIDIYVEGVKKDPLLVTPIGICLNYYDQRNNFIFVNVNGDRVKLYNNNKLTIFDAAVAYGLSNDDIFPKRGGDLTYKINGKTKIVRGSQGEAAVIKLNGTAVGMNQEIEANDKIIITTSTKGDDASQILGNLSEFSNTVTFTVNDIQIICPKFALVNGELESEYYSIANNDNIEMLNYYTLSQLFKFMDISPLGKVYVNNELAILSTKIYENFKVKWSDTPSFNDLEEGEDYVRTVKKDKNISEDMNNESSIKPLEVSETIIDQTVNITVQINGEIITLSGKSSYVFVDIFDFYGFDTKNVGGTSLVMTIDGANADYFSPLHQGAIIKIYWKE